MESTANRGQGFEIARLLRQMRQASLCCLDHLASFLQEDLAHFVVFLQAGLSGCRSHGRCEERRGRHWFLFGLGLLGAGQIRQNVGQLLTCCRHRCLVVRGLCRRQGRLSRREVVRELALLLHMTRLGQAVELIGDFAQWHIAALQALNDLIGHSQSLFLLNLLHMLRHGLNRIVGLGQRLLLTSHQGRKHPCLRVELEERLRQLGLNTHHVDQETQGPQVGGEAIKDATLCGVVQIGAFQQEVIDIIAHAHAGLCGEIQTQHGQHTPHGLQDGGHTRQRCAVLRVAEELIDVLFCIGQRGAQLLHHRADGVTVGDTTVQVLHPDFQRLGRLPLSHGLDPLGQSLQPWLLLRLVKLAIFETGLHVQEAGGHFHRQARLGCRCLGNSLLRGVGQCRSQHISLREQTTQGVTHQCKLLVEAAQTQQLTTRDGRPTVLGSGHSLQGLRDPGWIKAPKAGCRQVDRLMSGQAKRPTHTRQHRAFGGRHVTRLRTKEQQLAGQAIGRHVLSFGQYAQLAQQGRQHALGMHAQRHILARQRLQEAAGQHPGRRLTRCVALRGIAGK